MHVRKLSDDFSVTSQIAVTDLTMIKDAGFKSIICNRPDGESSDQPSFRVIEEAAAKAGLVVRWQPIASAPTHDDARRFAQLLQDLPKPVLAYCRSGMRSSSLWSMSQGPSTGLAATVSSRLGRLLGTS